MRPEKVRIADKHVVNQNVFHARVTNTVYIGADTHIYVDTNGTKLKVLEQNRISRLDPKSFYTVGQEVWLMLMPENTLVLKKD
ncbi:MAG: TOBE domain-containing protein [Anaerolineales bacterium]|nr:TOBE domain-containing protein [Anaerolineales bacterium]